MDRVTQTFIPKNPNGIFILGEFAEINDWRRGYHFSGGSGQELKKMCREADFNFYDCYHDMVFSIDKHTDFRPKKYVTDWTKKHPFIKPEYQEHVDHVKETIYNSGCNLVLALGDLALFILTGDKSVTKWRGSCMYTEIHGQKIKVIPTFAPSRILKVWDWRHIAMYDLRRVNDERSSSTYRDPGWKFQVDSTYNTTIACLEWLLETHLQVPRLISHDLETINRHISCSGIAWSRTEAICIPFMTREEGAGGNHNYWTVEQEANILWLQQKILTHSNARVVGQNYLYDMQHIAKSWGYAPNIDMDTMLAWHTVFPGERKALDFISSLFCDHYTYWKDELKDYNRYPADQTQYWEYNCKDTVYTYEIAEKIQALVTEANQQEQYRFQMGMYKPVFNAMLRGVRVDLTLRKKLGLELFDVATQLEQRLLEMSGDYKPEGSQATTFWFNSPQQCLSFFYDYLGLPKQFNRKTHQPSTDEEALNRLADKEPIIAPIVRTILELRSVNIFRKNFIEAPLGNDNRIRCSYNLAGTETFRLSSSKDAFGQGANLQTIPKGTEKD